MKKLTIAILLLLTLSVNAQWIQIKGIEGLTIRTIAISGSKYFAATDRGILKSIDNGTTWSICGLSGININELVIDSTAIYAGKAWGFYISEDNGQTWVAKSSGIVNDGGLTLLNGYIFAGSYGGGVYRSSNQGIFWTSVINGLPHQNVYALIVVDNKLLAGLMGPISPWGVYVSEDNGQNWSRIGDDLSLGIGYPVYSFANLESKLFAGTDGLGVLCYTYNGKSWSQTRTGLKDGYVYSLVVVGHNIIAGSFSKGIFISSNDGDNWYDISEGLFNKNVNCLAVSKTHIFAGTWGGGIFKRPLSDFTDIKNTEVPTQFTLSQNYPNPFNPETTIDYQLSTPGFVTLKVYDLLGREVATLVDEYKQAGFYNYKFSIINFQLTSGVYFYRLQAGSFSETKKLILMK